MVGAIWGIGIELNRYSRNQKIELGLKGRGRFMASVAALTGRGPSRPSALVDLIRHLPNS
jgi:hypothetical protein